MARFQLSIQILLLLFGFYPLRIHSTPCTNPLPGTTALTFGFDLASLDLLDLNPQTSLPSAFRDQLFQLTCDQNLMFREYQLPDQIEIRSIQHSNCDGIKNPGVTICQTMDCFKEKMVGLTAGKFPEKTQLPGAFTGGSSYRWAEEVLGITGNIIGEVYCFKGRYIAEFNENWSRIPTESFAKHIKNLTQIGAYKIEPQIYQNLLEHFLGTHFFSTGIAFYNLEYANFTIDKEYYSSDSKPELIGFLKDLFNRNTDKLPEEFLEHTKMSTVRRFQDAKKPVLSNGYLRSISGLFENMTMKEQVDIAIEVHMTKAKLRELKRNLELIIGSGQIFNWLFSVGIYKPKGLLEQIEVLLSEVIPDKNVIEKLELMVKSMSSYVASLHRSLSND